MTITVIRLVRHYGPIPGEERPCELTDWKESGYLDTLAAACAASGDFDAAVKWQLKSIELAPDEQKAELRERLERYRAKEPNLSAR